MNFELARMLSCQWLKVGLGSAKYIDKMIVWSFPYYFRENSVTAGCCFLVPQNFDGLILIVILCLNGRSFFWKIADQVDFSFFSYSSHQQISLIEFWFK